MPRSRNVPLPAADSPLRPGGALSSVDEGDDVESRIYRAVFDSVMNQRLTPGTKLPENSRCDLRELERNVSVQRAAPDRTLAHLLGMA